MIKKTIIRYRPTEPDFLELEPASYSDKEWKYIFLKQWFLYQENSDKSTKTSENPTTNNISWIMNSADHSCWYSYNPQNCSYKNERLISKSEEESDKKRCHEERMTWWKWIIERVWNKWRNCSCNLLRTWSPLAHTKIDNSVEKKCNYDNAKDFQSMNFVWILFSIYSIEPYSEEKKCSPENDEFASNLNKMAIFWSYESARPEESISIEGKKSLEHRVIVSFDRNLQCFPKEKVDNYLINVESTSLWIYSIQVDQENIQS